ncbi:DUF4336 domain-containing protein [Bradyrhizobium sp. SZCCHNS2096]|uniref:DUF4336 domain-containing protein n=1 Tax=Bradyrhizobium sp. SZCCHNS2096 TaxID=3057309 RepID=UPI002916CBB7|nr:DUF4336 domain-containing protein [Bradyrhizobium sp. SZCCHNS2096]
MAHSASTETYPPLNTLKPIADGIWIVDGPTIRFGPPGLKLPFPTRMTVIRLVSGGLFVHSPTPLTPDLRAQIEREGRVRFLIGPNRIHYWWLPEWHAAFPDALVYLAPRIREQADKQTERRISFASLPLHHADGYPWDEEIATLPVVGSYMTEVEFFHLASRTLILTDLIENFEPAKVGRGWMTYLTWIGGVKPPYGGLPRDLGLTFTWRHRAQLRAAVETMIAWHPERIVIAHGKWHETNGAAVLRNAFAWLLK